ncbi:MAG: fumarylacetoacetate hydrolase family protein [Acidobacteria bacterium]|nr:fumarylacetoacetate hydrolase family protein [Acidobacteriota bacterium]
MRLATVLVEGMEQLAICSARGPVLVADINREMSCAWPEQMDEVIKEGRLEAMNSWYGSEGRARLAGWHHRILEQGGFRYAPLYRTPPKIWGIGLNYAAHARDLSERPPTAAPASFMKPATTIIGHGDTIRIPRQSQKTTAEAELGIVIGKRCKDVPREDWLGVVAGFTTIIDMTAEDILRQNPRYLTMSKSFDTFFSFGPQLVTPDEIDDVFGLQVATVINGSVHAENTVDHMTFPPDELVSFHSQVMTLLPGDVISTGTPGAAAIADGDEVVCRITGFEPLENLVIDLKKQGDL